MKKIISVLIGITFFIPATLGAYEFTEKVRVLDHNKQTKNLLIQRRGDDRKWLLHYKGKCDEIETGGQVVLAIRGELDFPDQAPKGRTVPSFLTPITTLTSPRFDSPFDGSGRRLYPVPSGIRTSTILLSVRSSSQPLSMTQR